MIIHDGDGEKEAPSAQQIRVPLPFEGTFRLTQAFGENPHLYRRFHLPGHNGLDWAMPEGQEVLAVDQGFVIRVSEDPQGFGKHIKIQHAWGQSLYAHLSAFKAVLNQPVKQGDVIGFSGNSGFSTGPHLHFGMRIKPYDKNDGWYGYTNPHRHLQWPDAGPVATASLATADDVAAVAFQLQETTMALELWEERIAQLLARYLPGELPEDADLMATLERLLASWEEELAQ